MSSLVGFYTIKLLAVSGCFLNMVINAFVLCNTAFMLGFDFFNTLKCDITSAIDTYFAATLDKLDKPDILIYCCGLGGVGISPLAAYGVDNYLA